MGVADAGTDRGVDWRRVHALGLPSGSVRALLAVMVFATLWGLLLLRPSREVPDYLSDLLFIIMGHYFAARARADQGDAPGPPPLYLPRGSVRFVLVAGFAAVAVVLFRKGQLTALDANPGAVTLLLVGGFLVGVAINALTQWWHSGAGRQRRIYEDVRALVSLAAALLLVALVWNRLLHVVPPERVDAAFARWVNLGRFGPEHALSAVVGFYFGSKS